MKNTFYLILSALFIFGLFSCKSNTSGTENMKEKRFISEKSVSEVTK